MTAKSNSVVYDGVSKAFGTHTVLDNLSLELAPGELITVLGPSGCGKTTALRILAGFERPTAGRVLIAGRDVTNLAPNKRGIGMVFQAYSLFPNLTVIDNVEYGLRIRRLTRTERRRRAGELLEMCGLAAFADRFPHQLSGGQQQRVALARALAVEPSVLLLDEPLSALDATVRTQIRDEIQRLQQELGITTMFVTHDQAEALAIADRVAVLNTGVIEQLDAPEVVYQRPASEFVARFVGSVTELTIDGKRTFIRPEDLTLEPDEAGEYTVTGQSYTGERTIIRATGTSGAADGTELISSAFLSQAQALPPGTRVSWQLTGTPAFVTETAAA
ncbi:ABC transporter ATP-binding protein [Brevibacterium gallinarum]|uniref:ABC transporter ATP-binding protein n=1 Tax=Brevibacterium gallinarum TaxID=2762220 RepID=A0ABR8WYX0_9MICO|nr:ABC transporter ATP-binding protein [Brevibacterium gallinarum]MBD8021881.1 ABC transporter ATP-binding protein [Brevibacterium gallinarum]